MNKKKLSRKTLSVLVCIILGAALTVAFWPQPLAVDIAKVSKGAMQVTIDEEATTQVADLYVLSAPISGHLLRVELKAGASVEKDKTVVARILPSPSGSSNTDQGRATISAAQAAVMAAETQLQQAQYDKKLAIQQAQRSAKRVTLGTVSEIENEQAQLKTQSADTAVISASAQLEMRKAQLATTLADLSAGTNNKENSKTIDIMAPASGKILRINETSEKIITAGAPIAEIGDVSKCLEIVVELLSSDAVLIQKSQRVLIDNWGGEQTLNGTVSRIEPLGFIKTSALGVEERRVKAIITLDNLPTSATGLGHGFRVDVAIVVWENKNTIKVPSSALFHENDQWAVFVVENDKAQYREVTIEKNNGTQASVTKGLATDELVILYPAAEITDGTSVTAR